MKWLLPSGTSSKYKPEENILKQTEKVEFFNCKCWPYLEHAKHKWKHFFLAPLFRYNFLCNFCKNILRETKWHILEFFGALKFFSKILGYFFNICSIFYLTMYALDLTCTWQSMTQKCLSYLMCTAISFFFQKKMQRETDAVD